MKDIREYKKKLRHATKEYRKNLDPQQKKAWDEAIAQRLLQSQQYQNCRYLLTYVSTAIEVDTTAIVQQALRDGKMVGVPRCIPNTRKMRFLQITSMEDLEKGTFGVWEPKAECTKEVPNTQESLCLIPALIYDSFGFRLGYGGGYYDRFLSGYRGKTIGLIYKENLRPRLRHGKFDVPISMILHEKEMKMRKI